MKAIGLFSVWCFKVVMVVSAVAVPNLNGTRVRISDNDVYPQPNFSKAVVLNMTETRDLREFIMKYVQDIRICYDASLRDIILEEDGGDERAKVWWSRRCGGRRGGGSRRLPAQSGSTLNRYRRKSSNSENPLNSLDRSSSDSKHWNKIRKLMNDKRVQCKPKRVAVPLPNPDAATMQLHPECVYIKRCSGCCNSPQLECVPTRIKTRTFPAMELSMQFTGSKNQNHQNQRKLFRMVKIEEHKQCRCDCKVRAHHCTSPQVYNDDVCRCECPKNINRSCSPRQAWNENQCRCECTNNQNCSTGRFFDVNTCRCMRT